MKIYILDQNGGIRFPAPLKIFLQVELTLDLDKLNSLKIRLARNLNKQIYDYLINTDYVGIRIQDKNVNLVFVRGNSEIVTDAQGISEFTFFGSLYDITYKQVNYPNINTLVSSGVQDILSTISTGYTYQLIGPALPSIEINIGAMDNLNLFSEVMKRAGVQWRETILENGRVIVQYGDFDYIQPKIAVYDYIRIDNYWNNNLVKIKSWRVKENSFQYDYVRFYNDKGSGTDGATTFDSSVIQDANYPVIQQGQNFWVQNGATNTSTRPNYLTKVINIPDSQNISPQSVKQILYENAISFIKSTQDDEEIQVELQSSQILQAGDKLLIVINQNQKQRRFTGTIRNVKYNVVNKECTCQVVANPRKDLRSKNLALIKNIQNESYQKKYTPIN